MTLLSTKVGPLCLKTPLLNASGCFWPEVFNQLFALEDTLGMVVSKTVKPLAQPGNTQQRTVEIPGVGMLNSIGLQGKGIDGYLAEELPDTASYGVPVMVSLAATNPDKFAEMTQKTLKQAVPVAAFEVNLSCPNVKEGGADQGTSPDWIREVITAVASEAKNTPLFAKVTPNITSTLPLAEAALDAGATGITAINTVFGLPIDVTRKKPSYQVSSGPWA